MEEIKNCPFCGYEGTLTVSDTLNTITARVRCNRCHTKGPTSSAKKKDGTRMLLDYRVADRLIISKIAEEVKRIAIQKWNNRV